MPNVKDDHHHHNDHHQWARFCGLKNGIELAAILTGCETNVNIVQSAMSWAKWWRRITGQEDAFTRTCRALTASMEDLFCDPSVAWATIVMVVVILAVSASRSLNARASVVLVQCPNCRRTQQFEAASFTPRPLKRTRRLDAQEEIKTKGEEMRQHLV